LVINDLSLHVYDGEEKRSVYVVNRWVLETQLP
jgi:hypothetical protein